MLGKKIVVKNLNTYQINMLALIKIAINSNGNLVSPKNLDYARMYAELDMLSDNICVDIDLNCLDNLTFITAQSRRSCFNMFIV